MSWAGSAKEYRARERAEFDSMPLRTRCTYCKWTFLGTALEGRERAVEHRLSKHPEINPKRYRQGRHLSKFQQAAMTSEDEAEIYAKRAKRARLHGVDLESV